ncbi:uncharacterized protein LOC113467142 [Diaphorina citri]|uniref:Uncharacterized protein LOC113467142 n=1 Tax=Diaphorina citri TaxID=121845 RepID=A0A3Q0IX27_DIACI|nr:uncharacterized protein LOC113467142 [Diaphorina citri]
MPSCLQTSRPSSDYQTICSIFSTGTSIHCTLPQSFRITASGITCVRMFLLQDKQHFIHLYKSRICVLNNMLPENYLCRRKFKVFTQLHFTLSKLCHDIVNHTYSFPLFLIILMESFQLTSTLYFTLTTVLQSKSILHVLHVLIYFHVWVAYNVFMTITVTYFHVWVAYNVFMLVWIIRHCEATKYAGNSLLELVYHKIIYDEAPALNPELTHFLDCICNHKIRLRALDVFDIDYTVLSHMMAAVITYGVVLVQLSAG